MSRRYPNLDRQPLTVAVMLMDFPAAPLFCLARRFSIEAAALTGDKAKLGPVHHHGARGRTPPASARRMCHLWGGSRDATHVTIDRKSILNKI